MEETENLKLPFIMPSQAQKHVTHNESIRALDALVQLSVLDRDLASPPALPAGGQRFIVAAGAAGAWAGAANRIAAFQDGAWAFYAPRPGWLCWVTDESALVYWNGTAWGPLPVSTGLQSISQFGLNTIADAANPFAAKLNKALWTARTAAEGGDGDLRYTLNKETAADVLSLLFQTGFSGRAELGLVGDDKLRLKMSADGATFKDAFAVSSNGYVGLGTDAAGSKLDISSNTATTADAQIRLRTENTSASLGGGLLLHHNNAGAGLPASGDRLGYLFFGTNDGGALRNGAAIRAAADGAYVAGSACPTRFVFETAPPSGTTARSERLVIEAGGSSRPGADNAYTLGSASFRWSTVYAATGTIQTSDARDKDVSGDLAFAGGMVDAVEPVLFRWKVGGTQIAASNHEQVLDDNGEAVPAPVEEPVSGARLHAGFLAQDLKAAMDHLGAEFAAWGLDNKSDAQSRQWTRPDQLVAVLWAALRETREEMRALAAQLGRLESGNAV